MEDRFTELVMQARKLYWEEVDDTDIIIPTDYELLFAEVIVQECEKYVYRKGPINFFDDLGLFNVSLAMYNAAEHLLKVRIK